MQGPDKYLLLVGIVKQRRSIGEMKTICAGQAFIRYFCFGPLNRPGLMMDVSAKYFLLLYYRIEAIAFDAPVV
jgi:hypothetical protein